MNPWVALWLGVAVAGCVASWRVEGKLWPGMVVLCFVWPLYAVGFAIWCVWWLFGRLLRDWLALTGEVDRG